MIRRALLAAALAGTAACGSTTTPTVTIGFREPQAIAIFHGLTLDDPATVRPYLAVANAARNDLTILDATDDTQVTAPVQLRALVLPVAERPVLLAAAPLGDGADRADLLVAVSAGDSVLQVITTWDPGNAALSEPGAGSPAVDLGGDVVALAALPSDAGTARIAAALAGGRIAVATWRRAADQMAIELDGTPAVATLGYQPLALAALPDDPSLAGVQTEIYAATLDPIGGVFGVAVISPDDLSTVRALGARAPTRLVAAARVRERGPAATAKDRSAFDFGAAPVPRVYAVLDESGCGVEHAIDCGVVTLDPAASGAIAIPADWAGRMPYRAPIRIPGLPLAIAVAPPPAAPPSPELTQYAGDAMRLFGGAVEQATTGVGVVASSDGKVYFLDLGRFKAITAEAVLGNVSVSLGTPVAVDVDPSEVVALNRRVWIQDASGAFVPTLTGGAVDIGTASGLVGRTPGWSRSGSWTVAYQAELPELAGRAAEAGRDGATPWLAFQASHAGYAPSEVVRIWHPALGVRAGDVAVIKAAGVPSCVGTTPAGAADTAPKEFEAAIAALLPPSDAHPGGAVSLLRPDATTHEAWATCWDALASAAAVVPRLTASIRASGFVVASSPVGYAGRGDEDPAKPGSFVFELAYPLEGEDALAAACPLVGWDGAYPADPAVLTCGGACDRAPGGACERAALARKARRALNNFESCETPDAPSGCATTFATVALPSGPAALSLPGGDVADPALGPRPGPVVSLRFGVQEEADAVWGSAPAAPVRGMSLALSTTGGEAPAAPTVAGSTYRASSAIAFDRSAVNPAAGYRFLVSYSGDLVLDASPHVTPTDVVVLR